MVKGRNPKAEIRKKSEGRNPKRCLSLNEGGNLLEAGQRSHRKEMTLSAGLSGGFGVGGDGLGRFCGRGRIGFVVGDEATTDRSQDNTKKELGFDGAETALRRMLEDGDN